MGWTHCFSSPYAVWKDGKLTMPPSSRQKEIDKMLTWESKDKDGNIISSHRVLKSSMVGSTYYAAVTTERQGKESKVWAAVFLTCGKTKHDDTIWGYKDMDETEHPYYYDCPAGVLSLLTPTDNKCANEWREECRKKMAKKAELRKGGQKPLFVPKGIEVEARKGSWIITSENYRKNRMYSGIRFSKAKWHEFDRAMMAFLEHYGTKAERAEYAASGRNCPPSWKGVAA